MQDEVTSAETYEGRGKLAMLISEVRSALYDMRQESKAGSPLGSRELSCAITNVEQGLHWLMSLEATKFCDAAAATKDKG
jgi:ribosomal protein S6